MRFLRNPGRERTFARCDGFRVFQKAAGPYVEHLMQRKIVASMSQPGG